MHRRSMSMPPFTDEDRAELESEDELMRSMTELLENGMGGEQAMHKLQASALGVKAAMKLMASTRDAKDACVDES